MGSDLFSIISFPIFTFMMLQLQTANAQFATRPITSMCSGDSYVCVSYNNKKMKCWGSSNSWGLTAGNVGDSPSELGINLAYVNVGIPDTIVSIVCGGAHVCIKFESNGMKCLGTNESGELGLGLATTPIGSSSGHAGNALPFVNIGTNLNVLGIAAGQDFTCAKITNDNVKCFGRNHMGQLGRGNTVDIGQVSNQMGDNLAVVDIGTGVKAATLVTLSPANHVCVILSQPVASVQRMKCWGSNDVAQLGYGDINNRGDAAGEMGNNLPLIDFGTESRVKQVVVGFEHTCALLLNDNVKCYGAGANGAVASGSTDVLAATGDDLPTVKFDTGKKVKILSAGFSHTCFVYDDLYTLKCVGSNNHGQLGQGDTDPRGNAPTTLVTKIPVVDLGTGKLNIVAISSGGDFSCVQFVDSSMKCFGDNNSGQLAIGSSTGNRANIGDENNEMGIDLKFVDVFAPTQSPTKLPTATPTRSPTADCTFPTNALCSREKRCTWKKVSGKNQCIPLNCNSFLTKKKCISDKKCKWFGTVCDFV